MKEIFNKIFKNKNSLLMSSELKNGINVMSLFDGISCGQVALNRCGIKINTYYASEIEKNAIKITQTNYPKTIQLGDVTKIDFNIYKNNIDLLIGGSPCQDLSITKKDRQGLKGQRSGLFFKYIEALKTIKPKYFLLENVASMSEEDKEEISRIIGVQPIMINSSLLSAQQRKRYYWTNIPDVTIPINKNLVVDDIIDKKNDVPNNRRNENIRILKVENKSDKPIRIGEYGKVGQGQRIYSSKGKSVCLGTGGANEENYEIEINSKKIIRKLSSLECERLQTLPDNYTSCISDSKRKICIGNGWTVDVIAHIFKGLKQACNQ